MNTPRIHTAQTTVVTAQGTTTIDYPTTPRRTATINYRVRTPLGNWDYGQLQTPIDLSQTADPITTLQGAVSQDRYGSTDFHHKVQILTATYRQLID